MKFLITGAYGFVGTNLCKYLVDKGHTCDALDIPAAKRDGVPYANFFTWEQLANEKCEMRNEKCDKGNNSAITHSSLLIPYLSSYDCVVHLAGKAHDLKKVASEQSYFDINVGLTQKIANAINDELGMMNDELRKGLVFIYFSSCKSVEQDTPYAKSKWAAEEWLRSVCSVNSVVKTIILRPAPIHGPGNKGNLNLLWSVVKHGIPWPLAAFENKRPFTSIGNICAAVEALAARSMNDELGIRNEGNSTIHNSSFKLQTYFICDDDYVSTNRIIELMAQARGSHARLWRLPKGLMKFAARVGDVLHLPLNTERIEKLTEDYRVDNSELKKALGWKKFPVYVEDGMLETFKSFLAV